MKHGVAFPALLEATVRLQRFSSFHRVVVCNPAQLPRVMWYIYHRLWLGLTLTLAVSIKLGTSVRQSTFKLDVRVEVRLRLIQVIKHSP